MKRSRALLYLSACILILAGCGKAEGPGAGAAGDGSGQRSQTQSGEEGGPAGNGGTEADAAGSAGNGGKETDAGDSAGDDGKSTGADNPSGKDMVTGRFRIVDGAESGDLVLAAQEGYEIYTFSPGEIPVTVDGREADVSALEDGMTVDIVFDGNVMETFPAQFGRVYSISAYGPGTEENPGGGYYDLCGLYLQVLDDLWDRDSGLNDGVSMISVDLSQAPGGLTQGEKTAVAWIFACRHNAEMLTMSYEELAAEGYLTEASGNAGSHLYEWEDGILFSITAAEAKEDEIYSLPVIKFDASKWRSPRGAYFFESCWALWPEMGSWSSYEIGNEAIS